MPIHLKRSRRVGDEWRVVAVCDNPFCRTREEGVERTVRRTWARGKFRESGPGYLCRSCSSSINIQVALAAKRNIENVEDTFCWLCEEIFKKQLDDKTIVYIEHKLGHLGDRYLIASARDFVAQFTGGEVPENISNIATLIENGDTASVELTVETASYEEEMKARALLHLETLAG